MINKHVEKYLQQYKAFEKDCLLKDIPSGDVPMLWLTYWVGDVVGAIQSIE